MAARRSKMAILLPRLFATKFTREQIIVIFRNYMVLAFISGKIFLDLSFPLSSARFLSTAGVSDAGTLRVSTWCIPYHSVFRT